MLSVKKLMYKVLTKIGDVLGIGTNTVTLTTSSDGAVRIDTAMPLNAYPILVQCTNVAAYAHMMMQSTGTMWARLESWNGSAIANTSVTLKIYYVRKVGGDCVTSVFSRLSAIASHLKGWWSHVKHKETSVQNSSETERADREKLHDKNTSRYLFKRFGNNSIREWLCACVGISEKQNGQRIRYHRLDRADKRLICTEEQVHIIEQWNVSKNRLGERLLGIASISERGWVAC